MAIKNMENESVDIESLHNPEEISYGFLPEPPVQVRRGPRTELTDLQLYNRRSQLTELFEGYWGEMARELQKCRKADDLIPIFSSLLETYVRDIVSVFCRSTSEEAPTDEPRKIRTRLAAVRKSKLKIETLYYRCQERLREVDLLLQQSRGNQRRLVRRERKQRRKEFAKTFLPYQHSSKLEHTLKSELQVSEARFARRELFSFLKSKRYELNPRNLGSAGAGLPFMGWRQSMRRCKADKSIYRAGLHYQIFKLVRYITDTQVGSNLKDRIADFRSKLLNSPTRYRSPKEELIKNWYHLEIALRQNFREKHSPSVRPYEITSRYFKQLRKPLTQVERMSAERSSLNLQRVARKRAIKKSVSS